MTLGDNLDHSERGQGNQMNSEGVNNESDNKKTAEADVLERVKRLTSFDLLYIC